MDLWDSIEFGARAVMLKSAASKPRVEIERISQLRLEKLVEHARNGYDFWREKLNGVTHSSFDITDLPTSSKPELMDNFDRALTVDDVRRDEVESFVSDHKNLGSWFNGKYAL